MRQVYLTGMDGKSSPRRAISARTVSPDARQSFCSRWKHMRGSGQLSSGVDRVAMRQGCLTGTDGKLPP